jgi:hypothetical protein
MNLPSPIRRLAAEGGLDKPRLVVGALGLSKPQNVLHYFLGQARAGPVFDRKYKSNTGVGTFWVSSLIFFRNCLQRIIAENQDVAEQFIDAGAGDFRCCLAAAELGFRSAGIEADLELLHLGEKHIQKTGLANPPEAVSGDFREDQVFEPYWHKRAIVYNFANSPGRVADVVWRRFPRGSTFMLYDGLRAAPIFQGLRKYRTYGFQELVSEEERRQFQGLDPDDVDYSQDRIHCYSKDDTAMPG